MMVTVTTPSHHTRYDSTLHHVLVLIYFTLVVEMYATFLDIKPIYLLFTMNDETCLTVFVGICGRVRDTGTNTYRTIKNTEYKIIVTVILKCPLLFASYYITKHYNTRLSQTLCSFWCLEDIIS